MARQPWGGRPNKAALARMKLGTIVVSIVAFVGSLGGVATFNPGTSSTAAADNQTQPVQIASNLASSDASTSSASSSSLTAPTQQRPSVMPVVRTRGS